MKTKLFLIAAVMFLAFTVSAFSQTAASYTVSQETLDRVACCGLAEPTGAISFNAVADSPATVTGTITLRYNLPIANTDLAATGTNRVQVTAVNGTTGASLTPQPTWAVTNDGSNGLLVIQVPAGYVYPNTIKVFNVRVNVTGSCGSTDATVTANASSVGNLLTIGETATITLVKGVAQPLKTPVVAVAPSPLTTMNVNASDGTVTGAATITISENFLTAFGITSTYPEPNRSQQTLIRLKVTAIPRGVTITFPQTVTGFETATSAGATLGAAVPLTYTATPPQYVYYRMTAGSNPAALDTLVFAPTIATAGPFPLAPATISISAAMAPITTGTTATLFPQYVEGCETAAVPFATVSGVLNTILLVPYATTESGYNTALTVANTTLDPGAANMATFPSAIQQSGKITVYFYPKSGATIAPWVSTTAPSQFGLDASGKLPAGGTFVALLGSLLPSTVTEFGGYVFIVTDFTNAHGEFFVSNFTDFTHGALMLVVSDLARATSGAGRTQEQGLNQ